MSNPFVDYDSWKQHMRLAIQAAVIANFCSDKIRRGLGAPNEDDIISYSEEGAAIAELWSNAMPK